MSISSDSLPLNLIMYTYKTINTFIFVINRPINCLYQLIIIPSLGAILHGMRGQVAFSELRCGSHLYISLYCRIFFSTQV